MSTIVLLDTQHNTLLHNFNALTMHMAKLVNNGQAFDYLIENPSKANWHLFKRFSSLPDLRELRQVFKKCTYLNLNILEMLRDDIAYLVVYITSCKYPYLLPNKTIDETYDCLDPLFRDIIYTTTCVGCISANGKFFSHGITARIPVYSYLSNMTIDEKLLALDLLYANDCLTYTDIYQCIFSDCKLSRNPKLKLRIVNFLNQCFRKHITMLKRLVREHAVNDPVDVIMYDLLQEALIEI